MPTMRVATLAVLLGLVAAPAISRAAGEAGKARLRLLLLGAVPGGEHLAETARVWDERLAGALESRSAVELVPESLLVEKTWNRQPAPITQAIARARQLLAAGRQALLQLELERAVELLSSARIALRRHIEWLADPSLLVDVLMALGEALEAAGQHEPARDAYLEVLALVPGYVPNPDQLPSRCEGLFEQAGELSQGKTARLVLSSDPPRARVYLDGMSLGQTPLEVDDLPAGLHGLVVWREGFLPHRQQLALETGETKQRQLRLELHPAGVRCSRLRDALARADPPAEILAAARELGRSLGVERVLLSYLGGRPRGRRWLAVGLIDVTSERYLVLAEELTTGPPGSGNLLERLLAALPDPRGAPPRLAGVDFDSALLGRLVPRILPPAVSPATLPPVAAPPAARSWWQRLAKSPWFWTALATAGATVLTTGLVLGLRSTETVQEPDRLIITLERVSR